ncbi:hypothetical protein DFS34DRAFT_581438 [Phlyctochytrium arcticum]|nr:hypothetical protein DFS34DRAFT_581438 [Phlyctochytrium arcticum]
MSDSDEPVPPKSPYLDTSLDDVVVVKPDGAEDYTASKDGGFFKCACGKGFKKLSSLRSHARLHGRERNFICDKCHKGFLRKHDLTRHATSHISGVKPYICPCGVTFTRQDAMMRHIRAGRCERPGRGRGRTNPRSMLIAVNTPQHMGPVFTQYFPSPLLQQQQQQQQKQRSHPPQQPHSTSQPVLIPVFAAGHPPSEPSSSSFSVRP